MVRATLAQLFRTGDALTFRSHKNRLCCTAQIVAVAAAFALSGCGTVGLFGAYDLPPSPGVADAEWPRLIDTPEAPAVGEFTASVPDPATGERTQTDLAVASAFADERRVALAAPVISAEEKAALGIAQEAGGAAREDNERRLAEEARQAQSTN